MIQKIKKFTIKRPLYSAILVILAMAFSGPAWAQVSGPCANCHTMHNSQDNAQMSIGDPSPKAGFRDLLVNDCVGCHTSATDWKDPVTGAPIVYNTSEPDYPADTLAGGNFYWVKTEDSKGHNIFPDNPDSLTNAPGSNITCGADDCHASICSAVAYNGKKQGCTKCHMLSDSGRTRGYHHADDSNVVVGSEQGDKDGFYRFLSGHFSGQHKGVCGIEDDDWQHTKSATDHNEYLGSVGNHAGSGIRTFLALGHTMTAFCCACHGAFHQQENGASNWIRHPSDVVIPNSGEYAAYTAYDPLSPVARPDLSGWTTPSSTVSPGTDMVMCLSCHVPHGSPYDDLLRWDYDGMVAGTTGSTAGTGCFVCHTEKDGII